MSQCGMLTHYSFLYFYFYTLLHALVARKRVSSDTSLLKVLKEALKAPTKPVLLGVPTELAVGFIAGAASRAVSTPLSVVTVRMQTGGDDDDSEDDTRNGSPSRTTKAASTSPSFTQAVRTIYSDDGLAGFWAGASHDRI